MPETGMQCVMSCRSGKISRMASYRASKALDTAVGMIFEGPHAA